MLNATNEMFLLPDRCPWDRCFVSLNFFACRSFCTFRFAFFFQPNTLRFFIWCVMLSWLVSPSLLTYRKKVTPRLRCTLSKMRRPVSAWHWSVETLRYTLVMFMEVEGFNTFIWTGVYFWFVCSCRWRWRLQKPWMNEAAGSVLARLRFYRAITRWWRCATREPRTSTSSPSCTSSLETWPSSGRWWR